MIDGKTVKLRLVRESDLEDLYLSLNSIRMKGEFLSLDLISEHTFRHLFEETGFWSKEKGMLLVVHRDRLIGAIWFEKQLFLDCLDLHFYIFREEDRNQGWMTEGVLLFSSYLFASQKIERLQISVPDYSKAALRVAQKGGFQFEGIARSALFHRGKYVDLCIYSLLRSESKKLPS